MFIRKLTTCVKAKQVEIKSLKYNESVTVNQSRIAFDIARAMWNKDNIHVQEEFCILLLDIKCKIIGWEVLSVGSMQGCAVDMRLLFQKALANCATGFMCFHNHPSGDVNPSDHDINLNRQIKQASNILNIFYLDSMIVSSNLRDYYSFADNGLI